MPQNLQNLIVNHPGLSSALHSDQKWLLAKLTIAGISLKIIRRQNALHPFGDCANGQAREKRLQDEISRLLRLSDAVTCQLSQMGDAA